MRCQYAVKIWGRGAVTLIFLFFGLIISCYSQGELAREVRSGGMTGGATWVSLAAGTGRERISINEGWKFYRYDPAGKADSLIYDVRPVVNLNKDDGPADARPTDAVRVAVTEGGLKPWILPTGNNFIKDVRKRYRRPEGNPGADFPFTQAGFDDGAWARVDLPHDWAIKGPFYTGEGVPVGGGMGRLPIQGVAWYRRAIDIPLSDAGRSIFLDVDGAMSYAMVWLNGQLVGGWPYGYSSWRVDLTRYVIPGGTNQLAIRLDNPLNSSRWYPGSGIYRNVWLTKTNPVHVGQWGTTVTTSAVSQRSAKVDLRIVIDNDLGIGVAGGLEGAVAISTEVYLLGSDGQKVWRACCKGGACKGGCWGDGEGG